MPVIFADNLTEYSYVSKINVNCEEYKGYVKVGLPEQYLDMERPRSYLDTEYYIDIQPQSQYYRKLSDWYVKTIEDYSVSEIEKMYNGRYSDYLLAKDDSINFIFENPLSYEVDKISIDIIDSRIRSIEIFDKDEQPIDFTLIQDRFHYELVFDDSLLINEVRFIIGFDDLLKIRDISFYHYEQNDKKAFLYFYVDNECYKEFEFYFGEFGKDHSKRGSRQPPVTFTTTIETENNIVYNDDFDGDGIPNHLDNCPYVYNPDQKDTFYNGSGDACEDWSGDGFINAIDVCPEIYNPQQLTTDCLEDRFFEQNPYLIYIFAFLIAILFIALAFKVMKKE